MQFFAPALAFFAITAFAAPSPTEVQPPTLVEREALAATTSPITGTVGLLTGVVNGAVINNQIVGLLTSTCSTTNWACNTTVSGGIENLLGDGKNYTGKASIASWCSGGHCYGSAATAGSAAAPFTITCNTQYDICTGTIRGSINQTFVNGPQIQLWGWATPSGYCKNGTCSGSVTILGDPAY